MARHLRLQGTTSSAYRKFSAARGWRAIYCIPSLTRAAQPLRTDNSPPPGTQSYKRGLIHMLRPLAVPATIIYTCGMHAGDV